MTVDLATLTKLYIHRSLPTYPGYTFKLTSKYSNKVTTDDFSITYITSTNYGTRWAELSFAVTGFEANANYSGYYTLDVIGITAGGNEVVIESNLVKVKYTTTADTVFVGDNEDNEQTIYYR